MARRNKKTYSTGKLPKLWAFLVKLHKENPSAFDDEHILKHIVSEPWKALKDPTKCPNCSAKMITYRRKVDYFVVVLVVSMGELVRHRLSKGMTLTDANKIHVNAESAIPHNSRNQTGTSSSLGLIAPVKGSPAHWAITSRGFEALRGDRIPEQVITFRDEIIERPEGTITFAEAIAHKPAVDRLKYNPADWYDIESRSHQGALL